MKQNFNYPLLGKILECATCFPSMKMVGMSPIHPLRWITRENYWYFGHSTFTEIRITYGTFYIIEFSLFAHFKRYLGVSFSLKY